MGKQTGRNDQNSTIPATPEKASQDTQDPQTGPLDQNVQEGAEQLPEPEIPAIRSDAIPEAMYLIGNRCIPMWMAWLPALRETMAALWLDPAVQVQALPPMEVQDAHYRSRWQIQATATKISAQYLPFHRDLSWQDQVVHALDQLMQHKAFAGAVPVVDPEILGTGAHSSLEINPVEWQFRFVKGSNGGKPSYVQVSPADSVQFRFDIRLVFLGLVEA
jgi:hypothetical protein